MAQTENTSSPNVHCILCNLDVEDKITGPLSSKDGISAHQNCLLYSSGIFCRNSPSFDDLFGFDVEDVRDEIIRGNKLRCHRCKKKGATVGCEMRTCKRSYHYPCAKRDKARAVEKKSEGTFVLYCEKHDPKQSRNPNVVNKSPHPTRVFVNLNRAEVGESHGGSSESGSATPVRAQSQKRKLSDSNLVSPDSGQEDSSPCGSAELNRPEIDKSHGETSSESDSATPVRSQGKKKKFSESILLDSDSDGSVDVHNLHPPVEDDIEEGPLTDHQKQSTPVPEDEREKEETTPCATNVPNSNGDETDIEGDGSGSPSLLPSEYRHEKVTFNVIVDSVPSLESENSFEHLSPSPAHTPASNRSLLTLEHTATTKSVKETPVSSSPSVHCPPPDGSNATESTKKLASGYHSLAPSCGALDEEFNRPSSKNTPPLDLSHDLTECSATHARRRLDLTQRPPMRGSKVSPLPIKVTEPNLLESGAALFWRRCNEVGCTETIFTDLTCQIKSLAETVQTQHATQEDYATSLKILEASGSLPAIFTQLEQDFKEKERELQRKRQALREAKAALNHFN